MKHYEEHKTSLTPGEKIRVAHAVLVWGWDDHKVAYLMNVNPGRVSEAVTAVRAALGDNDDAATGLVKFERKMRLERTHDVGLDAVANALGEEPDAR